ncbi:MAG: hypothetical protein EU529_04495 [Promethearchaeota archaeon]|nr:MAG: hypothetical protein EU529_04495 [Candidatus Lokiarchaeota archaeon]
MTKKTKFQKQITTLTLLLTIFLSSFFMIFPMKKSDLETDSNLISNDKKIDTELDTIENIESPRASLTGNDTWWHINWNYRQLITIENPYDVGFENYPAKIEFNYTGLVNLENGMNSTCKDIRIVENGVLRKYYFQQDYPTSENVTVWFETDIAKGPGTVEYDTYLYYGNKDAKIDTTYFMNESSSNSGDAFGVIRNGNFEWEYQGGNKINNFFGWYYTNNPPSDLFDVIDTEQYGPSYEHRLVYYNDIEFQERVPEGNYSFKWGDVDGYVDDSKINPNGQDYQGTLYSYPFIIPTLVDADINDKLYISFYANFRSYTDQPQNPNGFNVRVSDVSNYGAGGSSPGTYTTYHNYETDNKQTSDTLLNLIEGSGPAPAETRDLTEPGPDYYNDGDLTRYFTDFDVTALQGDCVFFEACTYGPEGGKKRSVYAQIDDIKFNYELDVNLETEPQAIQTEVYVITKDVDGRIVPNAEVTLVSTSLPRTQYTDDGGSTLFSNVGWGTYNFTVNYTLSTGKEAVVFDSTKPGEENFIFSSDESYYDVVLILNMSTYDFEIVDWGGRPLDYGFVNIKESKSGESLGNLTLDSIGTATFRWLNVSSYYYEIYYNNTDYAGIPIKLNESIIYRSDYVKANEKFKTHTFDVNKTNITPGGTTFEVNQYLYTNGSTREIGNKKIINFTVILENMEEYLTNVSIYYINKANSTAGNLIFTEIDGYIPPPVKDDVIEITIRDPPEECANLVADNYEVYGLLIVVKGINTSTPCNGRIKVDLVETWNIYNKTALARMNIRVEDKGIPVDVARVYVKDLSSNSIVNLSSYVDKGEELLNSDGWVFGRINYLIPFWYIIGKTYNFTIKISGQDMDFNVTETLTGEWTAPEEILSWYNLTMSYDDGTLKFDVGVETLNPQTKFDKYTITEEVTWKEFIYVNIYYNYTVDGISWNPIPYTGNVKISFKTTGIGSRVYYTSTMLDGGAAGWLTFTLNSSKLTAGTSAEDYIVTISADEDDYLNPSDAINFTVVNALATGLSIHEYSIDYNIQEGEYSQFFGESINISIKYYDNLTKSAITGANLYYNWLNLGDIQFYEDPLNTSFYTLTLNTSLAGSIGLQTIKITTFKENYTFQQKFDIYLRVKERPTYVNNKTGFIYEFYQIWVGDSHNYTYVYRDIRKDVRIGNLSVYSYAWQRTDSSGNPLGQSGTDQLISKSNDDYLLDFDTEKKAIGYYLIYITMHKDNYELRTVVINLVIKIRIFDADLDATNLDDDIITVVHGKKIEFEVSLIDTTRDNIPLKEAMVTIEIGNKEYDMDEDERGVYKYTYDTDDVEAFYTSNTFTVTITIEKVDFDSDEIEVTVVVEMEEIFPGMPTFYFILIIAAIIGIVGAIVGYRIIQQARIPKFVKNIRKVKKSIKSRSSIPSIPIPTKNKIFLKELGREWSQLGIPLKDILGIKEIKSPTLGKAKDKIRKNGGAK